ncbi:uncharacterized protein LOC142977317 [Anticarsia gemmatalis]|uniref:uncharacterized protein LOC142977317 n=1 Tax=Anticarsia gemmatalis TaxID=129554 RepID=UPI003F776BA2
MALQLNNCCFCVELRTGSLIIGYLNLVGSILTTIATGVGLGLGGYIIAEGDADHKKAGGVVVAVMALLLLLAIVNLIFSVVLLIGIHKYKPGHVKAFVIFYGICIVLSAILLIVNLSMGTPFKDVVSSFLQIFLGIYFLLVIRSYHKTMNENGPAIYDTA